VDADRCFGCGREVDDACCLSALNFAADARQVTNTAEDSSGTIILSTHLDREESMSLASIVLRPQTGVIIEVGGAV
jgi:hypothetical protein